MKTTRVTLYLTDGRIIDGVERQHDGGETDWADMCGNVIGSDMIAEVRDAG